MKVEEGAKIILNKIEEEIDSGSDSMMLVSSIIKSFI